MWGSTPTPPGEQANVLRLAAVRSDHAGVRSSRAGGDNWFPIGFAHRPTAADRAGRVNLGSMLARGELIWFPIGFAHRPRGFGLQARAATSVAAYLPLLAAWFSVSRFINE